MARIIIVTFFETVRFLYNDDAAFAKFNLLLSEYRDELLRLSGKDTDTLRDRKNGRPGSVAARDGSNGTTCCYGGPQRNANRGGA